MIEQIIIGLIVFYFVIALNFIWRIFYRKNKNKISRALLLLFELIGIRARFLPEDSDAPEQVCNEIREAKTLFKKVAIVIGFIKYEIPTDIPDITKENIIEESDDIEEAD